MITLKKLTVERIAEIEKVPITYDEDSPKFTKVDFNLTGFSKRIAGQARNRLKR